MNTPEYEVTGDPGGGAVLPDLPIRCFFAGTLIGTAEGERPVEALRPGDLVRTVDSILRPVRWIAHSVVSRRFADPLRVLPIRIRAGALGEGVPTRDLLVSPNHAFLVDDLLIQANALVNGATIMREHAVPMEFTYYHVELDTHSLLFAEGAPAESFLEDVNDITFADWEDRVAPLDAEELDYPRVKSVRQLPRATGERLAKRAARGIPAAA
jgi:Hint domain